MPSEPCTTPEFSNWLHICHSNRGRPDCWRLSSIGQSLRPGLLMRCGWTASRHRASHFGPDALARNDASREKSVPLRHRQVALRTPRGGRRRSNPESFGARLIADCKLCRCERNGARAIGRVPSTTCEIRRARVPPDEAQSGELFSSANAFSSANSWAAPAAARKLLPAPRTWVSACL